MTNDTQPPSQWYWIYWSLILWGFVAVKIAGTSLAAWSWWWVLLPIVPMLSLLVRHFGL